MSQWANDLTGGNLVNIMFLKKRPQNEQGYKQQFYGHITAYTR